jgi:hypothetical protein
MDPGNSYHISSAIKSLGRWAFFQINPLDWGYDSLTIHIFTVRSTTREVQGKVEASAKNCGIRLWFGVVRVV